MHDYREVHSQVALSRPEPDGPLIPDFILTDREVDKAAILELKLPKPRLVTHEDNRNRFSAAVTKARTQLLRYRDWFERKENRESLVGKLGMEVYKPKLIVIIGRSSEFVDSFDRQQLQADNPDIEVYTYDDIATFARRRRMIIEGATDNRE